MRLSFEVHKKGRIWGSGSSP